MVKKLLMITFAYRSISYLFHVARQLPGVTSARHFKDKPVIPSPSDSSVHEELKRRRRRRRSSLSHWKNFALVLFIYFLCAATFPGLFLSHFFLYLYPLHPPLLYFSIFLFSFFQNLITILLHSYWPYNQPVSFFLFPSFATSPLATSPFTTSPSATSPYPTSPFAASPSPPPFFSPSYSFLHSLLSIRLQRLWAFLVNLRTHSRNTFMKDCLRSWNFCC